MFDCFCLLAARAFFYQFRLKLFLKLAGFQSLEIAREKNYSDKNVSYCNTILKIQL